MRRELSFPRPEPGPAAPARSSRGAAPADVFAWSDCERTLVALRRRLLLEEVQQRHDELQRAAAMPERPRPVVTGPLGFALELLRQEQDPLGELNAALARIRLGCYGRCEDTGAIIPTARLRAAPWTRRLRDLRTGDGIPASASTAQL